MDYPLNPHGYTRNLLGVFFETVKKLEERLPAGRYNIRIDVLPIGPAYAMVASKLIDFYRANGLPITGDGFPIIDGITFNHDHIRGLTLALRKSCPIASLTFEPEKPVQPSTNPSGLNRKNDHIGLLV